MAMLVNADRPAPQSLPEQYEKPHPRSHLAGTKAAYTTVCGHLRQKQWVCGGSLVMEM